MDARVIKAQTKAVIVGGSQKAALATESLGQGPVFVWGHALMSNMAQDLEGEVLAWRELSDIAQIIRYDARGHGESECTGVAEDYAWKSLGENMWQVTDSYSTEKVVLGGASMGCATSLYAACQRPEQVRGLVLVIPPTAWESRAKMQRNYRIIARIVSLSRGIPFKVLKLLRLKASPDNFQKNLALILVKHLARSNYRGVVGAMQGAALSDLPPRKELEKLTMPALILAWPDDGAHPLAVAESLRDTLPNAQLEVMKNGSDPYHWPKLVRQFITSLG